MEVDAEHRRMVSGLGTLAAWAVAGIAAAIAVFALVGPERVWGAFGPADLGDVEFETLTRRTSPNDALACPSGLCAATVDIVTPTFMMPAQALRDAFVRAIASEQRLVRVASNDARLQDRYVQRTPLLGYPDTIVVRFVDLGGGRSSLALYSRSKLGRSDLGANKARLERWLALLGTTLN